MKKTSLMIAALITLAGIAQAVQMSFSDNGWDQIVQTYDSGAFEPGTPSTIPVTFAQFNTVRGGVTLTLSSVTVTVTQQSWGGYYAVDNDAASEGQATVQHGVTGYIRTTVGSEYFLPVNSMNNLSTIVTSGGTITLAANDGDAIGEFNAGGADYYRLDGVTQGNALTASATDTRTTGNDAYKGTGNLSLDYIATQSGSYTSEGALQFSGGPATVSTVITVTYNYTPEPTSLALFAIGCAVLGMRRRPRSTLKV